MFVIRFLLLGVLFLINLDQYFGDDVLKFTELTYDELHEELIERNLKNEENKVRYTRSYETRNVRSLNGVYKLCFDKDGLGLRQGWYSRDLEKVCTPESIHQLPVPCAFNSGVIPDEKATYFVGWTWFERTFSTLKKKFNLSSDDHISQRILQFDGANYLALVWINGEYIGSHVGGHLPFAFDLTHLWPVFNKSFRLTIALSNILTNETLPTGKVINNRLVPNFDFFYFAGLDNINLVTFSSFIHVSEVKVFANDFRWTNNDNNQQLSHNTNQIHLPAIASKCNVTINLLFGRMKQRMFALFYDNDQIERKFCNERVSNNNLLIEVTIFDSNGSVVYLNHRQPLEGDSHQIKMQLENPDLWQPLANYIVQSQPTPSSILKYSPKKYILRARIMTQEYLCILDEFKTEFGIREVVFPLNDYVSNSAVLKHKFVEINKQPIKLLGFGMHMETKGAFSGRFMQESAIMADIYRLKQTNANTIRTSHYPYSSRYLDLLDNNGILVIVEAPAVGLRFESPNFHNYTTQLNLHKKILEEMLHRDLSRPSIIAWSIANEPESQKKIAKDYFEDVVKFFRDSFRDISREQDSPIVTAAIAQAPEQDKIAELLDFVMVNAYFGWYDDYGYLSNVSQKLYSWLKRWNTRLDSRIPILMSEYGAESIDGTSHSPPQPYDVEYQCKLLEESHKAFDRMYANETNYFLGELLWNFADFSTDLSIIRPSGVNHKGIFTLDRKAKASKDVMAKSNKHFT